MTPSLEGWPTKAKEAPSPHEVRLTPLDTNPVFLMSRGMSQGMSSILNVSVGAVTHNQLIGLHNGKATNK